MLRTVFAPAFLLAFIVLGGAQSANAQSLERTYADICSDAAKAKSESCVALAQALVAKLQGGATSTNSPTPEGPGAATLADKRVAPPPAASPQQTMEQRWGLYLGLVDKKLVDVLVGGNVPYEFPAAIVTFVWDIPGQVLGMSQVQPDGSTTKMATLRWDEKRGGLVETSLDGVEGVLLVPQADGSYVALTPAGTRITQRKIENDAVEMRTESNLGNRWELGWLLHRVPFTPESFDLMKQIHANSQNGARLSASMDPKYRDPAYLRMVAEREAAARAAKAERRAGRAAVFGAVLQGVAQGAAEVNTGGYAEAQANLDATVANIQYAADVERQQQALAAQQEQARAAEANRQQLAENARWVAEKEQVAAEYRDGETQAAEARKTQLALKQQEDGQRRTAAEADRRKAQQDALREQGDVRAQATASGSLVLESVVNPSRRESTPPNSTADRQMLVACFLVHHGEFDQGKGVVFFSSTVPVAMEKGRAVGDPTGTFRRKVKSSYNIDGGTACQTLADAAGLQSFMQEVGTSYRRYRKIDTGLSPLE